MAEKRAASSSFGSSQLVKRQRSDNDLSHANGSSSNALIRGSDRPTALQAAVMELSGHSGEVFAARFDSTGQHIASGSMDRDIRKVLWSSTGACENYGKLSGHKGAVLDLAWSRDSRVVFSASADMHVASWDAETGQRIRRHTGHEEVINCLETSKRGEELLFSGSDDGSIGIWDPRQKAAIHHLQTAFPVTALAIAEAGHELYSGGIDNEIRTWDMRKRAIIYQMSGHGDTVTSLSLSPDGQTLLSHSHDATVRTWDVRPFAPTDRALRTFDGARMGLDKNLFRASWDPAGKRIAAGSGDRSAIVWDASSGRMLHKLPGHKGAVNDVRFAPGGADVLLSASTDRTLLLGELS
ncbi:hypothetical protein ANO11243_054160 [Dothideomycetidae sp. 11243]|nr:hypothetical protein ANO11243_054160 [fungal sp. No.11243]